MIVNWVTPNSEGIQLDISSVQTEGTERTVVIVSDTASNNGPQPTEVVEWLANYIAQPFLGIPIENMDMFIRIPAGVNAVRNNEAIEVFNYYSFTVMDGMLTNPVALPLQSLEAVTENSTSTVTTGGSTPDTDGGES